MSVYKISLNQNVLEAAEERITRTLENLPRVCVSFSGGKDSGLMLHLTANLARKLNKRSAYCSLTGKRNFPAPLTILAPYAKCMPMSSTISIGLPFRLPPKTHCLSFNLNGSAGNPIPSGFANRRQTQSPIRAIFLLSTRHDFRTIRA